MKTARSKWRGGPTVHDPTLRTKGGAPKRTRTAKKKQPPFSEKVFRSIVVSEVERPPDRKFQSGGLTALHDWDLPYYLQLVAVASDTKVARTVRLGLTQSGHEVLVDLDFGGRILGVEVV